MIVITKEQQQVISFIEDLLNIKLEITARWFGYISALVPGSYFKYYETMFELVLCETDFTLTANNKSINWDRFKYNFDHQELKDFIYSNAHISVANAIKKGYIDEISRESTY